MGPDSVSETASGSKHERIWLEHDAEPNSKGVVVFDEIPKAPVRRDAIGAPLLEGCTADLHGQTVHADICRAVLQQQLQQARQQEQEQPHDGGEVDESKIPHADININDRHAGTALHWAINLHLHDAALAIIACPHFKGLSARMERDGSTPLQLAAAAGLDDIVEALLTAQVPNDRDKDGFGALHGAAYRGHMRCVSLLLESPVHRPSVSTLGSFDCLRPKGHWALEAVSDYDMRSALHMAASQGHADVCKAIFTLAPSHWAMADATNRVGATALHMAARGGHTAVCIQILQFSEFTAVNEADAKGFTALHWAAKQASGDMCRFILEHFRFSAGDKKDLRGRTAYQLAEELGHHEACRQILQHLGMEACGVPAQK